MCYVDKLLKAACFSQTVMTIFNSPELVAMNEKERKKTKQTN